MSSEENDANDQMGSFRDRERVSAQDECLIPDSINHSSIFIDPEYRFKYGVSNVFSILNNDTKHKKIHGVEDRNEICKHIVLLLENKSVRIVKYLNPIAYTFAYLCAKGKNSSFEQIDVAKLNDSQAIIDSLFTDNRIKKPDIIRYCKFIIANKSAFV